MFAKLGLPRLDGSAAAKQLESLTTAVTEIAAKLPTSGSLTRAQLAVQLRGTLVQAGVRRVEDQLGTLDRLAKVDPDITGAVEECKRVLSPAGLMKRLGEVAIVSQGLGSVSQSELAGVVRAELSLLGKSSSKQQLRTLNKMAEQVGGETGHAITACAEIIGLDQTAKRVSNLRVILSSELGSEFHPRATAALESELRHWPELRQ